MLVDSTRTKLKGKVHVKQIFLKDGFCHFLYFLLHWCVVVISKLML